MQWRSSVLSFCSSWVFFLYVMWMIYCMDDMMAFTVVFNIQKINKVPEKVLDPLQSHRYGLKSYIQLCFCVGRASTMLRLFFLFPYLHTHTVLADGKERCDSFCALFFRAEGSGWYTCSERRNRRRGKKQRGKWGWKREEEGNVSTGNDAWTQLDSLISLLSLFSPSSSLHLQFSLLFVSLLPVHLRM